MRSSRRPVPFSLFYNSVPHQFGVLQQQQYKRSLLMSDTESELLESEPPTPTHQSEDSSPYHSPVRHRWTCSDAADYFTASPPSSPAPAVQPGPARPSTLHETISAATWAAFSREDQELVSANEAAITRGAEDVNSQARATRRDMEDAEIAADIAEAAALIARADARSKVLAEEWERHKQWAREDDAEEASILQQQREAERALIAAQRKETGLLRARRRESGVPPLPPRASSPVEVRLATPPRRNTYRDAAAAPPASSSTGSQSTRGNPFRIVTTPTDEVSLPVRIHLPRHR